MYIVSCLYKDETLEKRFIYEVKSSYEAVKAFVEGDMNGQTVHRLKVTRMN